MKENISSLQKASSTKMEGAKYPRDSRMACLIYLSYPLHSICVGLNANLAVVILQMHCQMKLQGRRDQFFFAATLRSQLLFELEKFFSCGCLDVMLDCNGLERLHQYRFSFIYRNLLASWPFRLAARHFTDSSLKWSFFDFPNRGWLLRKLLIFFASYSVGYLWKQNLPLEKVRFPDACQLRSSQYRHF